VGWLRGLISVALAYPRLWLCRRVAANIAVSEHVSARLGLPRTTTIYNAPAERSRSRFVEFARPEPIANYNLAADPPLFAFIGRLTSEKGVSVFLHAAAALAAEDIEFRVRIIGDGPERARLAILAWSLRLRDRVEFMGTLEGAALEAGVSSAIGIVLPSLAEETAGLVAMEQMMQGRVIIASEIGGLGEIVGGAGLKFPPGDVVALTQCMRRVLTDPELRSTLGRAARSRALRNFTQQRMIANHMNLYTRLLNRAPDAPPDVRRPA
jgi:glycogen(starch) synthase